MDKIKCFIIETEELYLERVFVERDRVPLYFLCKGEQDNLYIALATDIDADKYVITKASRSDVVRLLRAEITMRDLILVGGSGWRVYAKENLEEDICEKIKMVELCEEELPTHNSFYMQ